MPEVETVFKRLPAGGSGYKNPRRFFGVGGTYDCIAILSYYAVCKSVTSFREIEEMEEDLVLPSFRKLKFVDCNKPFFRKLMYKAFTRAKSLCDPCHIIKRRFPSKGRGAFCRGAF